jgi:hypothetical protein
MVSKQKQHVIMADMKLNHHVGTPFLSFERKQEPLTGKFGSICLA